MDPQMKNSSCGKVCLAFLLYCHLLYGGEVCNGCIQWILKGPNTVGDLCFLVPLREILKRCSRHPLNRESTL